METLRFERCNYELETVMLDRELALIVLPKKLALISYKSSRIGITWFFPEEDCKPCKAGSYEEIKALSYNCN